jgi:transcriptional regulator GlxA family with amidase domain
VVPGGISSSAVARDEAFVGWVRRAHATSRWTTSVCAGALILGAAGILEGLKATTHWLDYEELATYGARPTPQRVVEQGKVVTSAGVSSGIDMALTLAARMAGDDVARAIQLSIEYDPKPPFDAGSVGMAGAEIEAMVRAGVAARTAAQPARVV